MRNHFRQLAISYLLVFSTSLFSKDTLEVYVVDDQQIVLAGVVTGENRSHVAIKTNEDITSLKKKSQKLFQAKWGAYESFSHGEEAILKNEDGSGSLVVVVGHNKNNTHRHSHFIVKDLKTNKIKKISDPKYSLYSQTWKKKVSFAPNEIAILNENNMEEVRVVGRRSSARPNKEEFVVWSKRKDSFVFIDYSNTELFSINWGGNIHFKKLDKIFYKDINDVVHAGVISGRRSHNDGSNARYAVTLDQSENVVEVDDPKYSLFNQNWSNNSYFKSDEIVYVRIDGDKFSSAKVIGYKTDPSGSNAKYIVQTLDNQLHFVQYPKIDLYKSDWKSASALKPLDNIIYTENDSKGSIVGISSPNNKKYLVKLEAGDGFLEVRKSDRKLIKLDISCSNMINRAASI